MRHKLVFLWECSWAYDKFIKKISHIVRLAPPSVGRFIPVAGGGAARASSMGLGPAGHCRLLFHSLILWEPCRFQKEGEKEAASFVELSEIWFFFLFLSECYSLKLSGTSWKSYLEWRCGPDSPTYQLTVSHFKELRCVPKNDRPHLFACSEKNSGKVKRGWQGELQTVAAFPGAATQVLNFSCVLLWLQLTPLLQLGKRINISKIQYKL